MKVEFIIEIEELKDGKWVGFTANDLQVGPPLMSGVTHR